MTSVSQRSLHQYLTAGKLVISPQKVNDRIMKTPKVLELRPCQFVLGMKEVDSKVARLKVMNKKELRAYVKAHVVPVVKGPGKELYIIDHHHFLRACWQLGIKDFQVHLMEDLSDLEHQAFWNKMIKRGWTYLYDQFGLGPHSPQSLPMDIRCLADDPYRSLAWALIESGAILKSQTPFFEFKWCSFFRLHLPISLHSKSDFTDAIKLATDLATSKAADHLPGFTGKKEKRKKEKKEKKEAKKKLD